MKRTAVANGAGARERAIVQCRTVKAWATWLAKHHKTSVGVWLMIARKDSGARSVTHAEALDEAICHGWIDGTRKRHDDTAFLQLFTPRGKRSVWSKINREKALALIEAGRMRAAGLAEVERAKGDGRWESAYDGQRAATVPPDLAARFARSPRARAFFALLTSQNRYAILHRIHAAKKAETRERRIEKFAAMCERGETVYPQPAAPATAGRPRGPRR
jgi:uncharacterized protein YdeI (YjbR/CyaY-like superfamily)